jgi:hypothetical protein
MGLCQNFIETFEPGVSSQLGRWCPLLGSFFLLQNRDIAFRHEWVPINTAPLLIIRFNGDRLAQPHERLQGLHANEIIATHKVHSLNLAKHGPDHYRRHATMRTQVRQMYKKIKLEQSELEIHIHSYQTLLRAEKARSTYCNLSYRTTSGRRIRLISHGTRPAPHPLNNRGL